MEKGSDAFCGRIGLGKLYQRAGQHEQTSEHLSTAATMFREVEMKFWLEQAEAEMREPV